MVREKCWRLLLAVLLVSVGAQRAHAQSEPQDSLVQPPTFAQPERGSLAGAMSALPFGVAELARGSFSLPLPVELPAERGSSLANILPTYSIENGLSEWGIGWSSKLTIERYRVRGTVDYQDDELSSPWGRLAPGQSGWYYPAGFQTPVRARRIGNDWRAIGPDGTTYTFEPAIENASGIYSWHLVKVESLLGARTVLKYDSGTTIDGVRSNPVLEEVLYGPPEAPESYRVTFGYEVATGNEGAASPFVSYRSGYPVQVDRRVAQINFDVRNRQSGAYARRWAYAMSYRDALYGPSFYLDSVMRTFASEESEPPIVFDYELPEEYVGGTQFFLSGDIEVAPEVAELVMLANNGDILSPGRAAFLDVNQDGATDLEFGGDETTYVQNGGHWDVMPLPPRPADVDPICRPSLDAGNGARSLVRLAGPNSEVRVLAIEPFLSTTEVRVCDQSGSPLHVETLESRWVIDSNTKLVDINRDERPDLVRVLGDTYDVQENISGDGCGEGDTGTCVPFGFRAHPPKPLSYLGGFPFSATGTWFHDMNGDGLADLVLRSPGGISVWFGSGSFEFAPQEHQFLFHNAYGGYISDFDSFHISWVDVNKDSLTDAILSEGRSVLLLINEGDRFRQARVQALEDAINLNWYVAPLPMDLRGSGDTEVTFAGLNEAYAISMNAPSTGLLTAIDDGKGTVVSFEYSRAAAEPGILSRPSILSAMRSESGGLGAVTSTFSYGSPTVHSEGHYLVGFGEVSSSTPGLSELAQFLNDDDVSSLVTRTELRDARTPGVLRFATREYEKATLDSLPFQRPARERSGYCQAAASGCLESGTAVATETIYRGYQRAICPTQLEQRSAHGTLAIQHQLAAPSAMTTAFHCLSETTSWTGTHSDSSMNFELTQRFVLNSVGQLEKLTVSSGDVSLELQEMTYAPSTRRLRTITSSSGDETRFDWDPASGQLMRVIEGNGAIHEVSARDELTDSILALISNRGPGGILSTSFRYDGAERLEKTWSSFGGSSEAIPLSQYQYQWPSQDHPGLIALRDLVAAPGTGSDSDAGQLSQVEQALWQFPTGDTLASAVRTSSGWAFGEVHEVDRAERKHTVSNQAPVDAAFVPETATYAQLQTGSIELNSSSAAGFGYSSATTALVAAGVSRETEQTMSLDAGVVVYAESENPRGSDITTRSGTDATGRVLWAEDASGVKTTFTYDVLGRLRQVALADGTLHRLTYDSLGRPSQIYRQDVGWITYEYDSIDGLLAFRDFYDAANNPANANATPERSSAFLHDSIGRVTQVVHRLEASEQTDAFTFRYDGALGDTESIAGQRGYLTQAEGPDFKRTTLYNPDDSIASTTHELGDWIVVSESSDYHAGGQLAGWHREVRRAGTNELIDQIDLAYLYDAWGRLERILLGEQLLATLHYDARGRFDYADLAGGQKLAHFYDPETLQQNGYQRDIGTGADQWTTAVGWQRDERGLIDYETFSAADTSWRQDYAYDARRFLQTSTDGQDQSSYAYTTTGLPSTVTDLAGTRRVDRGSARQLTVNGDTYAWDAQGRIIRKGDLELLYGPNGDVATARVDGRTIDYRYDDDGQRLLKLENGAPVAAFLGGSYITADDALTPIRIMGSLVGYVRGGAFQLLATDPRGTLIAEDDGTRSPVTPFGVRLQRPELAAALDYVEKAYDPDLRSIRMGARDYDPLLSQFQTPDPLYLEQLDKCAESPIECNLYGYSLNNPLLFIDPSGLNAFSWLGDAARGFGGAAYDAGEGLWEAGNHPIRTLGALGSAVAHPVRTVKAVYKSAKATATAVAAGDPEASGAAVFEIGSMLVGVGIVTKAAKVTKLTKLANLGKAAKLEGVVARGGAKAVRVGQAGESAVRLAFDIGEKAKILINGRNRIPDGLTTTVLSEIKNVESLSFSRQLRDFADYAQQTGRRFDLYVRPNTKLSGPLQEAVQQRTIQLRFIP